MIKRNYYVLISLSILLSFLTIQNVPSAIGIKEIIYDPADDVLRFENHDFKDKGDFKDDIDIIMLELDGQHVNITFAAKLVSADMTCTVYFFEHYDPLNISYEYGIYWANYSYYQRMNVFFVKFVEGTSNKKYWNGIDWSYNIFQGQSMGSVSNNTIRGNIPLEAWNVPNNVIYYAISRYGYPSIDQYTYADYAPDNYSPYKNSNELPSRKIPGNDLFTLFSVFFGMSYIILKKKKKIISAEIKLSEKEEFS